MTIKAIAIVPARGGSKRIPRKNIKLFSGKPIISYSITLLIESQIFDEIHVSTDDEEIAEVAQKYGASVPFMRPEHLAGDTVPTVPVIADHVRRLNLEDEAVVCCMYATAPLVTSRDLIDGFQLLKASPFDDYVLAVSRYGYPIQRALSKVGNIFEMIDKSNLEKFSQQLEARFHDSGTFYFAYAKTWLRETPMLQKSKGIEIPSWRVQDIDTLEDWKRAQIIYEMIKSDL